MTSKGSQDSMTNLEATDEIRDIFDELCGELKDALGPFEKKLRSICADCPTWISKQPEDFLALFQFEYLSFRSGTPKKVIAGPRTGAYLAGDIEKLSDAWLPKLEEETFDDLQREWCFNSIREARAFIKKFSERYEKFDTGIITTLDDWRDEEEHPTSSKQQKRELDNYWEQLYVHAENSQVFISVTCNDLTYILEILETAVQNTENNDYSYVQPDPSFEERTESKQEEVPNKAPSEPHPTEEDLKENKALAPDSGDLPEPEDVSDPPSGISERSEPTEVIKKSDHSPKKLSDNQDEELTHPPDLNANFTKNSELDAEEEEDDDHELIDETGSELTTELNRSDYSEELAVESDSYKSDESVEEKEDADQKLIDNTGSELTTELSRHAYSEKSAAKSTSYKNDEFDDDEFIPIPLPEPTKQSDDDIDDEEESEAKEYIGEDDDSEEAEEGDAEEEEVEVGLKESFTDTNTPEPEPTPEEKLQPVAQEIPAQRPKLVQRRGTRVLTYLVAVPLWEILLAFAIPIVCFSFAIALVSFRNFSEYDTSHYDGYFIPSLVVGAVVAIFALYTLRWKIRWDSIIPKILRFKQEDEEIHLEFLPDSLRVNGGELWTPQNIRTAKRWKWENNLDEHHFGYGISLQKSKSVPLDFIVVANAQEKGDWEASKLTLSMDQDLSDRWLISVDSYQRLTALFDKD